MNVLGKSVSELSLTLNFFLGKRRTQTIWSLITIQEYFPQGSFGHEIKNLSPFSKEQKAQAILGVVCICANVLLWTSIKILDFPYHVKGVYGLCHSSLYRVDTALLFLQVQTIVLQF